MTPNPPRYRDISLGERIERGGMGEVGQAEAPSELNLATGFTHLILCGTAGWAIGCIDADKQPWAWSTFAFLLGHGMLGILRFTHPHTVGKLNKLYDHCFLLANCAALPMINTQMFLDQGQSKEMSLCHAGSGLLPYFISLFSENRGETLIDVITLGNAASLAYLSFTVDSVWGLGLAALSVFNAFGIDYCSKSFEAPRVDLKTVGLCFFCIFAANMLTDSDTIPLTD